MSKNFNSTIRRIFDNYFGRRRLSKFLDELQSVARILIFLATVGLFLYALIYPHFWIILIIFLLFLALLALVND